ncbi:alpha/beta hydrolase domain-containing protein [Flammeovirgaceae bacterium 311]|nr:alpha/beta hydrolase domain-containing protein [Flammeovirgaceae bacterium 311]
MAAVFALSSCETLKDIFDEEPSMGNVIMPEGPPPEWAPDIDPQMLAVIEQLQSYGTPPLHTLTADQARKAPTPTDAVMDLLKKYNITPPQPKVDFNHLVIPNNTDEGLLVRTYTPRSGNGPFPVIVYYHGGGWVIAGLDTYEPSAAALAEKTGAIVVSVAYRQAPEHTFPAAHEDAYAAYVWARENAGQINGNPDKVATAGESAGGNLAVAVAIMAKERGMELPVHILSVYPIAEGDTESSTYDKYADAVPLNRPLMEWFFNKYVPDETNRMSPLITLTDADLTGLPPVTIINAEIDPLEAEGEILAEVLKMAGVDVTRKVYAGVTHEFFGMAAVLEQARHAQDLAASRLKESFK